MVGMLLLQACPVQIPWHDEEAEAGELGQGSSKEPRDTMSVAQPAGPAVLPLPLFPFLPEGEAPWPASPYPSQGTLSQRHCCQSAVCCPCSPLCAPFQLALCFAICISWVKVYMQASDDHNGFGVFS